MNKPQDRPAISNRQDQILELIRTHGFVPIESLAQKFNLTPQTIRRDINYLADEGLVQRYHGGAGPSSSVENVAYSTRQILCPEEKKKIGQLLATHIPNNASLFINIGTTTEQVAHALLSHSGLRVITNNLNVANILARKDDFEIIVAGGLVRNRDRGVIGEAAIDLIGQFKVDFGIIGISGIDADGTLLDFDYREVRASQAILANSRKVYLAADHTKFGRDAMVRMGSINALDAIFTDATPPPAILKKAAEASVDIFVSEEN